MTSVIKLSRSSRKDKKYQAVVGNQTVHFGATGYSDYTLHKDPERKQRYIKRHSRGNENWNKTGINTPGFWARWLLWNKPSISSSVKDIEKRFGVKIRRV